jgi:hypothetical protein
MSGPLPLREPLTLREVQPPAGVDPAPDLAFTLTKRSDLVVVVNRKRVPGPYGG